jgi:murein DD-endopeptidase MepM/ murein hydrolase activator NlpD
MPKAMAKEETLGDLEDKLNSLKQQKKNNDLKQTQTQEEIAAKKKAIETAQEEKIKSEKEIEDCETRIKESDEQIQIMKEQTEKNLIFLQQVQGKNSYVEYVTGASSMTDMIMRIAALEQITDYTRESMENLEKLIKENQQLKEELIQKQKDLEIKINNYQLSVEKLTGNLEEYDQYETSIEKKIEDAESEYNKAYSVCKSNPKTSNLGRNAVINDCYGLTYNTGWLKPLNKGVITSDWGWRYSPINHQKVEFHNALDIGGNPEGTPVYAAAAGIVSGYIYHYSCGGNMVYIKVNVGGVNYTTYYYHLLTVNVSVGQQVTQSTIIGTVGGYSTSKVHGGYDGCTTGAHLHYGVAKGSYNGSPPKNQVITPPGFPNQYGYRFNSRTDYWG